MNILIIDTNTCNLEKAKYIHEWLSEQLDDILRFLLARKQEMD